MTKALFIAGTDTDVGKTEIACGLLHAAKLMDMSTAAVKPVAAGCQQTAEGLRNDDALKLQKETSISLAYDLINPVALEPPIAPHIAAAQINKSLTAAELEQACRKVLDQSADLTVVEGAGGWRVPLNERETLADLAKALDISVVLVVGLRLGCINHSLLTVEAIAADGLQLAGWVANHVDPQMACQQENIATLQQLIAAPCIGTVPYMESPSAEAIAAHLDLEKVISY